MRQLRYPRHIIIDTDTDTDTDTDIQSELGLHPGARCPRSFPAVSSHRTLLLLIIFYYYCRHRRRRCRRRISIASILQCFSNDILKHIEILKIFEIFQYFI